MHICALCNYFLIFHNLVSNLQALIHDKWRKAEPHIPVILPFYKAENTLDRAIESIAAQSLENFECILINNNSTDKSIGLALK